MRLEVLHEKFYKALYEVVLRAESWAGDNSYFYQFQEQMNRRSGFVIVAPDGRLAGCISFSDYVPMTNIIIHASIDAKYHRRWVTRRNLAIIANYVYEELGLPRMSGFSVAGKSDIAGEFLIALGFKHEGTIRKGARIGSELFDLKLYGLLKEECRWLKEDMRRLKPAATHLGSGEEEKTPAPLNRGESEKIKSIHTAPHKGGAIEC